MSLTCVLRDVTRKLAQAHLKTSTAVLCSSALHHHNFGQLGHQNSLLLEQNRSQYPSTCLQHVKNFSVSPSRASSHDHGKLWGVERMVSISLLGSVPLALLFPSQALDSVLALSMVMHSHWGLEACVIDYVRPIIFGPVIPKISLGLLYLASIGTLAGLFYLIFNDMGLANTILKLWKL